MDHQFPSVKLVMRQLQAGSQTQICDYVSMHTKRDIPSYNHSNELLHLRLHRTSYISIKKVRRELLDTRRHSLSPNDGARSCSYPPQGEDGRHP